ncbi:AAA family ATPase [Alcaligenaceae bacterium CGII-47]|nr:AAA family ATPase [Alcaligenaceae bacterium CGII-47]
MRLRRLRIEQLRQFRQPLEIRDINPGINLFVGPNESGKSTIVRAIRAAFFERFKSNSVDDLQPWGDSSAAPSVKLEFDWQGECWTLTKSFLKHKRCDLNIAGRLFNGEEAEEKLAQLLGFQFPGRGASKAEHWGIPGLLWIDQGTGQDIDVPVTHAQSYLKSVLGKSLGEVASSAGDALIVQVERERAVLLTSTGRPTGEYSEIQKKYVECEAALKALDQDIATYRQQVDRLGELLQHRDTDATRPWEAFRHQAAQASAQLAEVQGWEQAQQREEKERQHCADSQQHCRDQLAIFAKQQEDLALRASDRHRAAATQSDLQARRPLLDAQLAQARMRYHTAEQALRLARQREQRALLVREASQLDLELSEIENKLSQSRNLQAQLLEQRSQLQANRIDATSLSRLQALTREISELDIAQQSVATRLQFELLPAQHIQLGDEALSGQGQRLLLEPVDLDLPGVGKLRIQPGGEDIADLARRRQTAQASLSALFEALQVQGLSQAEAYAEQRRTLQDDIKRTEFQLGSLAPQGLDELSGRQVLGRQRQQALERRLADLPEPDAADITVAVAEGRLEAAREQLKVAEQAISRFDKELSLANQAVDNAHTEWQRLQDAVQAPSRQEREKALNAQLAEQRSRDTALQASLAERRRQIDAANPDILRQDIQRFTKSADTLQNEAQQRTLELASLQSRLEALGANGLEEQRAELARQFEYIGRRHAELQRRAAALELLLGLLRAKRQALTRRIQAPLQRHLNHYLQLLFVQARLSVNEALLPEQLVRVVNGSEAHEDFAALSFGAREQMGLISRLAYADLLKEAGRPTLIILDDALVHTDQQRLMQMKRILFDAAQRHQILLFTCHPDNWQDLGVAAVQINALAQRSI